MRLSSTQNVKWSWLCMLHTKVLIACTYSHFLNQNRVSRRVRGWVWSDFTFWTLEKVSIKDLLLHFLFLVQYGFSAAANFFISSLFFSLNLIKAWVLCETLWVLLHSPSVVLITFEMLSLHRFLANLFLLFWNIIALF